MRNLLLFTLFCLTALLCHAGSIWEEGSQWDVYYQHDSTGSTEEGDDMVMTYRLLHADDGYMALEETVTRRGEIVSTHVQGLIRNDGDSFIYVRPALDNGTFGEECLLYDFSEPFEYGNTVRYGVMGGEVMELFIDWQEDTLDYYMYNDGDMHCLPAWKGIVYQYGYIGGPMELFLLRVAPGKTKKPKPTNISHVIFSSKGGRKATLINRDNDDDDDDDINIPYDEMLTDGTTWECLAVNGHEQSSDLKRPYTIQVAGDTLVGNRRCKQIYSPEYDTSRTLFEEGRKLYLVNEDSNPEVVLDFNLQEGDRLDEVTTVIGVWEQENMGYHYRTITIDTGIDCAPYFTFDPTPWYYHLIEGIGASKDEFLGHRFINQEETFSYLLKCWKDGTLVYQVSGYDAVEETFEESKPTAIYDLQGHRLKSIPQEGIYIHNGKKIMRK